MAKKYSTSQQIGDHGHTYAASEVTRLGHLWHDRRVDHGIDAEIELVDPGTREPLNRLILVQSKASHRPFPGETSNSFHYLVTSDDMGYWLNGSNEVIVVCSHPASGDVWWAPARRATPPPPGRKSWRIDFDKHADRLDAASASRLLDLGTRGGLAPSLPVSPTRRVETLHSNLLLLVDLPDVVYVAPTWQPDPRRLGRALRESGCFRSDWVLREGLIHSFEDPRATGLDPFVEGGVEAVDTESFSEAKDLDTSNRFAHLLRQALREQEHGALAVHHRRKYFYFRPSPDLELRRVKTSSKGKGRAVFQPNLKKSDSSTIADFRHFAATINFVPTLDGWAAQIVPTYHFTSDGHRDLPWGADRVKGMKRLEKNSAVSSLVRFWADYLARPDQLVGDARSLRFGHLLTATVDIGIDEAAWKAGASAPSDPPAGQEALDL